MSAHDWDGPVLTDANNNGLLIHDQYASDGRVVAITCDSAGLDGHHIPVAGFIIDSRERADIVIDRLVELRDRAWPQ